MGRMQRGILENYMYMSEVVGSRSHVTTRFDHDCPAYSQPQKGEKLPLCPTFQELDSDANRIPSDIVQTRCRCKNCVLRHKKRHQNMCKPVLRHIPVLKKVGCVSGVFEYREFLQEVSVSCVCTKKPISHMDDHESSVIPSRSPDTEKMAIDFEPGSRDSDSAHNDDDTQTEHSHGHQHITDHIETEKMPE
ncbi:uncharacterized protein [Argopecten irradians]|uniref:uncharacterized protein n=1 Tax=Argopecten irradians TaxID=31199 RepID=UPI0037172DFE